MTIITRINLRSFTVAFAFALSSVFAAFIVFVEHEHMHEAAAVDAGRAAVASAHVATELIQSDLNDRAGIFAGLSRVIEAQRLWSDLPALQRFIDHIQAATPGASWIGLSNTSGRLVVGSGGLAVGADVSRRSWYIEGQARVHHGDLHEAALLQKFLPPLPNGEPWRLIDISMPIHDDSKRQLVGVLGVHLSWPWLRDRLRTAQGTLPHGGEIFLIGEDDQPRFGGDGAKRAPLKLQAIDRARRGEQGWLIETWADGHSYITAYVPQVARGDFEGFGWVTLVRTRADILPPAALLQYRDIVSAAIALVTLITLAAWGASTVWLRPLRAFAERIRDMRTGQAPPALPRRAPQEFHVLNYAIHQLVARLDEKEATVRQALEDMEYSFRSVGSSIPGVLATFHISLERKLIFDFISDTCERYFGVTGELLTAQPRTWSRHVEPQDVEAVAIALRGLIDERSGVISHPLRVTGGDGLARTLQVTLVKRDHGKGRVFDVIALDITELETARREAEQASRAKSDFLATMSHELRTPLNAILGFSRVLEDTLENSEQRTQARYMRETGETLTSILNDVLDIAKIESGKFDLDPQSFSLRQALDSCESVFRGVSAAKGLALEVQAPQDLPLLVGDPVRLRQILHNLLSNAIKFTASGTVRLIVQRRGPGVDGQGRRRLPLTIRVEDTGVGMTPEQLSRLFERFEQAERSTARLYGGTGLGLAIVKALVDKMGGHIDVRSHHGAGTAFSIDLDFDLADRPEQAPVDPQVPEAPLTVLVVDDFPINRHVLRALLQKRGHTVIEAQDGVQAIERVYQDRPDLVLMDIDMPNMDGLEATRRIRVLHGPQQEVPVYALTGKAFTEDVERTRQAGMNGHLCKPIQLDALVSVLRTVAAPARSPTTEARA